MEDHITEPSAEDMDTQPRLSDGTPAIRLDEDILLIEVIAKIEATRGKLPPQGTLVRVLMEKMVSDVMIATIRVLIEDHGLGEIS